jgi:RNA polymerase sigma-70 factor (sigma-E family)
VRGDQERQFVEFVTMRMSAWRRLARLLCGDWHRADDVVQETITSLYVHWRRACAADDIDRYARRMLVNAFLAERRRPWSRVHLTPDLPDKPMPEGSVAEDRDLLQTVLPQVPARQRAAVVLRFLYDLPVSEVAQILGCSTGTVKSQTARGLATLRSLLDGKSSAVPRKER